MIDYFLSIGRIHGQHFIYWGIVDDDSKVGYLDFDVVGRYLVNLGEYIHTQFVLGIYCHIAVCRDDGSLGNDYVAASIRNFHAAEIAENNPFPVFFG